MHGQMQSKEHRVNWYCSRCGKTYDRNRDDAFTVSVRFGSPDETKYVSLMRHAFCAPCWSHFNGRVYAFLSTLRK